MHAYILLTIWLLFHVKINVSAEIRSGNEVDKYIFINWVRGRTTYSFETYCFVVVIYAGASAILESIQQNGCTLFNILICV